MVFKCVCVYIYLFIGFCIYLLDKEVSSVCLVLGIVFGVRGVKIKEDLVFCLKEVFI